MKNIAVGGAALLLAFVATEQARGAVVDVSVNRSERKKVLGLDEQLDAMRPTGGGLRVNGKGAAAANSGDWQIDFTWAPSPREKQNDEEERKSPDPWPQVAAAPTDAEKVRALLLEAVGDSFGGEPRADWRIESLPGDGPHRVTVEFPGPQTGLSKARQFRVARRLVGLLLRETAPPDTVKKPFKAGLFRGRVLANYDAEGVGYGGSTLLDRAVDETSLDARILPVCPEDIRDGVLDGAAGVMFPGGSGKAIAKALRPEGVEKVRDFVAAGGGYYGVCAGAYFANSGLEEYAGLMHLKHHQPWRKGKGMLKVTLTEDGKKILGEEFADFETRYNCGPVFTNAEEPPAGAPHRPVTVLANFASAVTDKEGVTRNEMIGTPAILSGQWGQGRVVTVSPHPESHSDLSPLVARAIALSLGLEPLFIRGTTGENKTDS